MISAAAPRPERRAGPLTDRGLAVALTVRLRNASEQLDDVTRQRLLGELRALVDEYAPRSSRPIA
jgi:hypothetical protein